MMGNLIEILETISLIKTSLTLELHVDAIRQLVRCVALPMEETLMTDQLLNLNLCSMFQDRSVLRVPQLVLKSVVDNLLSQSFQLKLPSMDQSMFSKSFRTQE